MNAQLQDIASFRPMSLDDAEAAARIESEVCDFPWSEGNFRDSLCAGYSCWICEFSGLTIGYGVIMVAVGEAHLLNLGIAPDWQGKGLGRRFLRHLINRAREYHAESLLLEVRPSNQAACQLYLSSGFTEIAVRKKYYPAKDGREDALLMALSL